jgi:hypothetical protein
MSELTNMLRRARARFRARLDETRPELKAAQTGRIMLIRRTREGRDVRGQTFRPYRPGTIRVKVDKGQQTSPVNLTDTGRMLDGLEAKADSGRRVARVAHRDRRYDRIIGFHKAGTRYMARRDFFGHTQREVETLNRQVRADIETVARPVEETKRVRLNIIRA